MTTAEAGLLEWKSSPSDNVISINSLIGQVVELELIKNTDQCLTNCEAIIEVRPNRDITADSSYYFWFENDADGAYDLRSHEFYIEVKESYEEEYIVSSDNCYRTEKNGSKTSYSCNQIVDTRTKYNYVWEQINFKELEFKAGETYKLKLVGHKEPTDSVDWKMNFFGEKIDEWAWWNGAWGKCKQVNITAPDSTLKDFVIPINITYDSDMQGDFEDIRFVNSTGAGTCVDADAELNIQLDSKTDSNSAIFWVQLKNFNTTSPKKILMYYNNAGASDSSTNSTWNDTWVSTWNFQDELKDSSQQTNELIDMGGYTTDYEVGVFGQGLQSNSSSQAKILNHASLLGTTQQSVALWVYKDDTTIGNIFGYWSDPDNGGAAANRFRIRSEADGDVRFGTGEVESAGAGQYTDRVSPSSMNSGVWTHIVAVYNNLTAQNMKIYINGTVDDSVDSDTDWLWASTKNGTVGGIGVKSHMFNGTIDAMQYYNGSFEADWIKRSYESSDFTKITFGAEEAPISVETTLLLPTNNSNFSTYTIDFSANSTASGTTLNNATLYVWNSTDGVVVQDTVSVTGTLNTSNWTETLTYDDTYLWNVLTKNVDILSDWGVNRTFTIDTVVPNVNIVNPIEDSLTFYTGANVALDLNFTNSDAGVGVDSCWYSLNSGANTSIVGCVNTTVTVDSQPTVNSVTVFVNDTVGNENYNTTSFAIMKITNEGYSDPAYETEDTKVNITLGYNSTEFAALTSTLYYNGTAYPASLVSSTFDIDLTIPLVGSGNFQNKTWFWEIGNGAYLANTSEQLHTVYKLIVNTCGAPALLKTYNVTLWDEVDLTSQTADLDSHWNLWVGDGSVKRNYTYTTAATHEHNFCIYPNETSMSADIAFSYSKTNYATKEYNLLETTINNITQELFLYLLPTDNSTIFVTTSYNGTYLASANQIINVNRYYPSTSTYLTVEAARTDDFGQTILHLDASGDTAYKFVIEQGGVSHYSSIEPSKPYCSAQPCTLTFYPSAYTQTDVFENKSGLSYVLRYANSSGLFTYSYVDATGTTDYGRLFVISRTGVTDTTVCNVTSAADSATLTCNVSSQSGALIASAYHKSDTIVETFISTVSANVSNAFRIFGNEGIFWAIMGIMSIAMLGLVTRNPLVTVIFVAFGVVAFNMIGLIGLGWTGVTAIIVLALIILWQARSAG